MDDRTKRLMSYYIRMLRLMRGYTQQDIADKLNKTTNAISNWELGNTSPTISDFLELCKILDVTPNQLCGWEETPELIEYCKQKENTDAMLDDLRKKKSEIEAQIKFINEKMKL